MNFLKHVEKWHYNSAEQRLSFYGKQFDCLSPFTMKLQVHLSSSLDTCFVGLPSHLVQRLHLEDQLLTFVIFKLYWKEHSSSEARSVLVCWTGDTSSQAHHLEISKIYGTLLGLHESCVVELTAVPPQSVPAATSVTVEPESADDWELLELNPSYLESQILNQVMVLSEEQVLPIRLHRRTVIKITVGNISPSSPARLVPGTEVLVAPKSRNISSQTCNVSDSHSLRVLPMPEEEACYLQAESISEWDACPFLVFVHSETFTNGWSEDCIVHIWNSHPIDGSDSKARQIYAIVKADASIPSKHIRIPENLRLSLQSRLLTRVWVQPVQSQATAIDGFSLCPVQFLSSGSLSPPADIPEQVKKELMSNLLEKQAPVVCNDMIVNLAGKYFALRLWKGTQLLSDGDSSEDVVYSYLDNTIRLLPLAERCQVANINDPYFSGPLPSELGGIEQQYVELYSHVQTLLSRCKLHTRFQVPILGCAILLWGPHGSGKSSFIKALAKDFRLGTYEPAYCDELDGRDYVAQSQPVKQVIEQWRVLFQNLLQHEPSILLFHHLDEAIPAEQTDPGTESQSLRSSILANALFEMLVLCQMARSRIACVFTCENETAIHALLRRPCVLGKTLELPPPSSHARVEVLKTCCARYRVCCPEEALKQISKRCDGYLPVDLVQLIERSIHCSFIRDAADERVLPEDFYAAQENFMPARLKGVALLQSELSWSDVGGLDEVLQALKETFEWPIKYSALFSKTCLKPRSGCLLYGPPGCGKTLLAGAMAGELGINFIGVKGPELLNKYIGASEQAVRDLFSRASAAAPCILFFDEFESIAPQRGHDSTGVTDRVVNQLLTQLDGVESLKGVAILAATSRPDLVDKALLRPGRLDKCLLCKLPGETERYQILKAQTRKMKLATDVDLQRLASQCNHYSGADLQALLYNAQLLAVHEILDSPQASHRNVEAKSDFLIVQENPTCTKEELCDLQSKLLSMIEHISSSSTMNGNTAVNAVVVSWKHVQEALLTSKPSLTPTDRERYEQIYCRFEGKGVDAAYPRQQKQTLA